MSSDASSVIAVAAAMIAALGVGAWSAAWLARRKEMRGAGEYSIVRVGPDWYVQSVTQASDGKYDRVRRWRATAVDTRLGASSPLRYDGDGALVDSRGAKALFAGPDAPADDEFFLSRNSRI